ncbi:PLD nuclease N-terminal domain-containing protein [Paracoccus albus]|uniref:PLD nuclease N-terminal domain-containing protein n=1 Tax=Paracoccus albus TaxID=3017784 RepID=UPI0022F01256|nr:PLD nuclease N-terminal domain-containing protein [Paracoccus albus]WBU60047.1 PLD nuclease N-terminal domain-containing protein [Paracoccus albus]
MQLNMFNGLIGIVIFALDVWAIAQIINSGAERTNKIIWVLVVAFLPVIGLIAWYFMGPKANVSPPR